LSGLDLKCRVLALVWVCSVVFALPVWAQTTGSEAPPAGVTDAEMEELERLLGGGRSANGQTGAVAAPAMGASSAGGPLIAAPRTFQDMNPDLSVIVDVALAAFSREPMQTGGHDPRVNGFNLQQLEIALGAPVDPFWRFDSNLVYAQNGVEIEEAYATSLAAPFDLQARIGQFLTRFGRVNATHPHTWDFVDQMLVIGKFMGSEGNRGLGSELSWLLPVPWYCEWVVSANEAKGGATARSFFGNENLGVASPLDVQWTTALRQFFPLSPDWSLAWGLNGATGPNGSGRSNRTDILGTDVYLKWRPLEGSTFNVVSGTLEAMVRRRQQPGALLEDHGGYASVFWRFAQQWATAVRAERVSGVSNDPLDPDWVGDRTRYAWNVTFWPTEFSRFRLQGSLDQPTWRPEPIYAAMLTVETVTGAHGAHKF
jgi:hypothetical protein